MANKLISTNLERFLDCNNWISAYMLKSRTYRALIDPNWPKSQSLNPHNFTKHDHR